MTYSSTPRAPSNRTYEVLKALRGRGAGCPRSPSNRTYEVLKAQFEARQGIGTTTSNRTYEVLKAGYLITAIEPEASFESHL